MKKYYAVIDTNVIVSALLKHDSIPGSIFDFYEFGVITPLYDDRILQEYKEVLHREKFHFNELVVNYLLEGIISSGIKIDAESIDIDMPDLKDKVFYEVVMENRKKEDSYLVTGNIKHFPKESFIVTPREMLDIIIKDNLK